MYIHLIDNTKTESGLDSQSIITGQNDHKRQVVANQGIIKDTDEAIFFFSSGLKKLDNDYWIDKDQIFIKNDDLTIPGIIVIKDMISGKTEKNISTGEEEFFKVIISNIEGIPESAHVIVNARTAYRFNYKINNTTEELFYVDPKNILVYFRFGKIKPGPNYMLLDKEIIENEYLKGAAEEKKMSGICNQKRYYFDNAEYDIEYDNRQYIVVSKKDIKLTQDLI